MTGSRGRDFAPNSVCLPHDRDRGYVWEDAEQTAKERSHEHPREGHGRADGDGDSPAPGPRREPAQLLVVAFICQGHLGSDEQDLPMGRGARVSLRWTRPVDRKQPTRPSARQWTMTEQLRPGRCALRGSARGMSRGHPPSTDLSATGPRVPKPHPVASLSLSLRVPVSVAAGTGRSRGTMSPARCTSHH